MYHILKKPLISLCLSIVFLRGPSKPYRLGVRVHISSILPKMSLQSMFFFGVNLATNCKISQIHTKKTNFPNFFVKIFCWKKKKLLAMFWTCTSKYVKEGVAWALGVREHWWQISSLGTLDFTIHSLLLAIFHASLQVACNYA